jgi:MoxR-like ATPase
MNDQSPQPAPIDAAEAGRQAQAIVRAVGGILLDKEHKVRLALACILARGHLLIEDLPGTGKTVLAHALARALGLEFKRVQFTSDLLPADILGTAVYDRDNGGFRFHAGPVFTQVLLADEINRSTPKTQSALLEAMEERQVSVEGETRPLPGIFFVIATQNPLESQGTYPLPEAQLDRFLLRVSLGHPGREAELALLGGEDRRALLERLEPVVDSAGLLELQRQTAAVHASPALLEYVWRLLTETRQGGVFRHGLSSRAGLALLAAARAWALMDGRDHVLPGDAQAVLPAVTGHRLKSLAGGDGQEMAARLVDLVPLP